MTMMLRRRHNGGDQVVAAGKAGAAPLRAIGRGLPPSPRVGKMHTRERLVVS
jgi:hypothetical protein